MGVGSLNLPTVTPAARRGAVDDPDTVAAQPSARSHGTGRSSRDKNL